MLPKIIRNTTLRLAVGNIETISKYTPQQALIHAFAHTGKRLEIALCLHRVGLTTRPRDPLPEQTISPLALDRFLELARLARKTKADSLKIVITFDDGYKDAFDYVCSRAPIFPEFEWILFVCPEKVQERAGFRWDLWEASESLHLFSQEDLRRPIDGMYDNQRTQLLELGDRKEYLLAGIDDCMRALSTPNVFLGNHTNLHLALSSLSPLQARREIEKSIDIFESAFGECEHFAFPFGVPEKDFSNCHIEMVRARAPKAVLWSSVHKPYQPSRKQPGALLPRMGVSGKWSHKAIAVWLTLVTLRHREAKHHYANEQSHLP